MTLERRQFVTGSVAFAASMAFAETRLRQADTDISGEYYDWQQTMKPEKSWRHDYSQTLVMKIFLCSRDSKGNVDKVYLTFDDALAVIRKLDNLTLGIPKIVYLVGWQYTGHDSGYPSWSVVNERLKRPQDRTAEESLKWLIAQARPYHTTVSLHINMFDAYDNSPLWDIYEQKNIVLKDKNGRPIKGEVFDGMQSYQISYAQEWKLGLAQKRIDGLLEMLPELKQAGTIHIDAFYSIQPVRPNDVYSSPYLGYTIDDEIETQRKIYRFWRMRGLDVTAEGAIYALRKDPFIGLQPMAWHFSIEDFESRDWIGKPHKFGGLPPTLYIGTPMHGEQEIRADPVHLTGLLQQFGTQVVPWYFHNNLRSKTEECGDVSERADVFAPALWLSSTIIASSSAGYGSKTWHLPQAWKGATRVKVMQITVDGLRPSTTLPARDGEITLNLSPGAVVAVEMSL